MPDMNPLLQICTQDARVHKFYQLTTDLQANEFLDPKDNLGYFLDSKI